MEALDVDARPAEQLVWHRSLGYKHPEQESSRVEGIALSSGGVEQTTFERRLHARSNARDAGQQRRASPSGAAPRLPWPVRSTSAQLMEGVGSECLTYGGADFVEVDADDLQ